jgi:hypothetical protein
LQLVEKTTRRFYTLKQSNKAEVIKRFDSRVASSRQNLNAVIVINHEGKTPGSVLCGLVHAPECALLVISASTMRRKIPVDALGTLRITEILSL